jgi:hypothetical protein
MTTTHHIGQVVGDDGTVVYDGRIAKSVSRQPLGTRARDTESSAAAPSQHVDLEPLDAFDATAIGMNDMTLTLDDGTTMRVFLANGWLHVAQP